MRQRIRIPQQEDLIRKGQRPAFRNAASPRNDNFDPGNVPADSGAARVLQLQQHAGNAATQRMLDHRQGGHGKDCMCIACKPQLMKSEGKPTAAAMQAQPAQGGSLTASFHSGTDTVQRWPWDDEEDSEDSGSGTAVATGSATETPTSDSDSDSGSSWWPFGGDDKKDEQPASSESDDDSGSWWPFGGDDKKDEQPSGDKDDDDSWLPTGWWPFGDDKDDEKGDDDDDGGWLPKGLWPFGDDKDDDDSGGDDDNPNLPPGVNAVDLTAPPVSSKVGNGPKEYGAGAIGCQVSDPNGREVEHGDFSTAFPNAVTFQGRRVPVRVNPTIEVHTRESSEATTSGHSWANIGAGATVFPQSDEIRDDTIAKPLGSTFPSFQVKDINWTYDSSSDTIEISCTFRIEVIWGTNSGGAKAVNSAEEPGMKYDDLIRAADEFEAIAKIRDSSNINFKFWNPGLTAGHEMVHVNQLNDLVPDAQDDFVDAVASIDLQSPPFYRDIGFTDGDRSNVDAEVGKMLEQAKKGVMSIMKSKWNSRGNEGPAYAAMSQANQQLADDLRKRAANTPPTP